MIGAFVRMHSGTDVPLAGAGPSHILIRDIAHHLALTNRFNGATETPYSVAQHSVLVRQILADKNLPGHVQLAGLLHDAHEAYLGDVASPVKRHLFADEAETNRFEDAARALDHVIFTRFALSLTTSEWREVMLADMEALATEWRDLMKGPCPVAARPRRHVVKPVNWTRAEETFLACFEALTIHLSINT